MRDAFGILCALALAFFVATLLQCTVVPPPVDPEPPPPPAPVEDAGPGPADDCAMLDAILFELQCRDEAGLPLWQDPIGRPFADYCRRELEKGVPWRVDCAVRIQSCDQLDAALKGECCCD